jgi:hypothetical protein
LGAANQQSALTATLNGRTLLDEPNPVMPVVSAAADDLRVKANNGFEAWKTAWEAGHARLKADEAWGKIGPNKKRDTLAEQGLLPRTAPDLSTPDHIAESLSACGISQWRDITLALPARVEAAFQEAAIEIEPKTQSVEIPRRTLRCEKDLDAWLGDVRAAIIPRLAAGPVLAKV